MVWLKWPFCSKLVILYSLQVSHTNVMFSLSFAHADYCDEHIPNHPQNLLQNGMDIGVIPDSYFYWNTKEKSGIEWDCIKPPR